MLMLMHSSESPKMPIGIFGVLSVVPNEGSIAHAFKK